MPAADRYHQNVQNSLEKEGWTITDDPYRLHLGNVTLYADLGAERILAAERGIDKIAVEIKTFLGASPMADLEQAIGQYSLYEDVIAQIDANRRVVLAIPIAAWNKLFSQDIGQLALRKRFRFAFVFNPELEEIIRWLP